MTMCGGCPIDGVATLREKENNAVDTDAMANPCPTHTDNDGADHATDLFRPLGATTTTITTTTPAAAAAAVSRGDEEQDRRMPTTTREDSQLLQRRPYEYGSVTSPLLSRRKREHTPNRRMMATMVVAIAVACSVGASFHHSGAFPPVVDSFRTGITTAAPTAIRTGIQQRSKSASSRLIHGTYARLPQQLQQQQQPKQQQQQQQQPPLLQLSMSSRASSTRTSATKKKAPNIIQKPITDTTTSKSSSSTNANQAVVHNTFPSQLDATAARTTAESPSATTATTAKGSPSSSLSPLSPSSPFSNASSSPYYGSTSTKVSSKTLSVMKGSPKYLENIDKYRGYRRAIEKWKRENTDEDEDDKDSDGEDAVGGVVDADGATIKKRKRTSKRGWLFGKIVSEPMIDDIRRRRKVYASDWTDAFKAGNMKKVVPACLFLYFSCLSPAVSFGTIASQITSGNIGIVEFLLSSGFSGMAYAVLCGQPMAFIAPTGLTLAFISGLYRFCSVKGVPFFPVYSWVGIWTSVMFVLAGLGGSSQWIRYCTRFTDEVFNALLSLNFINEAVSSLRRNFQLAHETDPMNLTMPFVALAMALTTTWSTMKVAAFETSKFFNQKTRTFIKDYGPVSIFILMSILNYRKLSKFNIPTLTVPSTFQLANGRNFWIDLNGIPLKYKLLCAGPAVLLTSLFFMDQNISVRVVNNPDNKLKKGAAYNLDMVALGLITGLLSLVGLPWMCGATVQSLNHVRAMTETRYNEKTDEAEIVNVLETRFTGFAVHALIASTLFLLPLLGFVPIPVVSGVFLFLGRKLMSGNSFLQRLRDMFIETKRLPSDHPIRYIGRRKTIIFTLVQVSCLWGLWAFKQNSATAIFFPSVIGMLMVIRSFILPKFFTEDELNDLGDPTPA